MRVRPSTLVAVCGLLLAAGCTSSQPAPGPSPSPSQPESESPQAETGSGEFSFNEMVALLDERGILVEPLPDQDQEGLLTEDAFAPLLGERMDRHPHWRVLSVHLALVDSVNELINLSGQSMYVTGITGPRTGNCFDLYDATNGEYWGSACFYPTRS